MSVSVFNADDARACVFAPRADDDKYRRGVVGLATGSAQYPGAARLGVEAAARTGCGMVRYIGPDAVGAEILRARPEAVLGEGRVDALVAGSGAPGLAEEPTRGRYVRAALTQDVPVVLDAGALELATDLEPGVQAVLTPHMRELLRLLRGRDDVPWLPYDDAGAAAVITAAPEEWALHAAEAFGATVLLKGAVTVVASADGRECLRVEAPTSVLATAGTGDVLAGLIGALLAIAEGREPHERPSLARLAATGAWLHGRAALLASARALHPDAPASSVLTRRPSAPATPVTALDLTATLPAIVGALIGSDAA